MNFGFLKTLSQNAGLKDTPNAETEQEVDLALTNISLAVDGANLQGQINCKKTLVKASNYIDPNKVGVSLDGDIALRLLRLCSDFTTDDMQELVAKILAGEYNQPGRFSLKTLDVVRNLTKRDIELFQKFCGFIFDGRYYLINPYTAESKYRDIVNLEGIGYDELNYLQDLGLVGNNNSSLTIGNDEIETERYFLIQDEKLMFKVKGLHKISNISSLTTAGMELLTITSFIKNDKLLHVVNDYFIELLK